MTINVIFLDIDGVLNSEEFIDRREAEARAAGAGTPTFRRLVAREESIDAACVVRLNRLIAETQSKVVISSSWRTLVDPPELLRILTKHGFVGEIIGETPDLPNDPEYIKRMAEKNGGTYGIERIDRGHEIAEWMRRWNLALLGELEDPFQQAPRQAVGRFVILDDCNDMAHLKHRHVCTDPLVGLTDADVELAINMMSWSGALLSSNTTTWVP